MVGRRLVEGERRTLPRNGGRRLRRCDIGILPKFAKAFGPCPFLCTGVLGTEDNARAPDESVSLEYLTKLTCAVASVLDAVPEDE